MGLCQFEVGGNGRAFLKQLQSTEDGAVYKVTFLCVKGSLFIPCKLGFGEKKAELKSKCPMWL